VNVGQERQAERGVAQNEPVIAANPANPNNLVRLYQGPVSATDIPVVQLRLHGRRRPHLTFGGNAPLERRGDACADPSITADAQGLLLRLPGFRRKRVGWATEVDVLVARSSDGGRTFPFWSRINQDPKDPHSPRRTKSSSRRRLGRQPCASTLYLANDMRASIGGGGLTRHGLTWSAPALPRGRAPRNEKQFVEGSARCRSRHPQGTAYVVYGEHYPLVHGVRTAGHPLLEIDRAGQLEPAGRRRGRTAEPGHVSPSQERPPAVGTTPGVASIHRLLPSAVALHGTPLVAWPDFPM